jgi:uncharacterized repeat protein (TIGR01451 family)
MNGRKLPLVKYLIGFSLALLAVSNFFNVQSNSSNSTSPVTAAASRIEAAKPDQRNSSRVAFAATNPGSAVASSRGGAAITRADLATHASLFSPSASPFAPTITATKSHMPAGNANPGDTLTYTIVIANSGTSDATGVNFSDTIDPNTTLVGGSVIASPIANDDSYHTIGNVNISVPVGQGVIANDSNPNGAGTLSVTKVNSTTVPGGGSASDTTPHGSVTMSSDGSFSYSPNAGDRAASDTFTYTLDNGTGKTDTATVTIALNGMIWFVDDTPGPAGDGRLNSPFRELTGAGSFDAGATDAANDVIFIYTGTSNYTGGLTLLSGQKIIGQGASQSIETITGFSTPSGNTVLPATGGTNPTITTSAANTNGVNLGTNNQLWGVTFGNKTGAGISGSGFGTLKVRDTTINGSGQALNLSTGTLDAIFQGISSSSSAATAVNLSSVGGTLTSPTTTVTSPTGIGIQVQSAPVGASFSFGTTSVTGSTNTGVRLIDNIGNVAFGVVTITPAANQRGLHATNAVANSGTITTTGGSISTSGAIAVEINRSSVGTIPLVMVLASVSTSGGPNGIVLMNTSGSFTVDGDGSNVTLGGNGSGGTISGMTGADGATAGTAVYLDNAQNVTLRRMTINGTNQNFGIRGFRVNGFTLEYATVGGTNGTNATIGSYGEGSVYFGTATGATGLTGSGTVTSCNISGGRARNFSVVNTSGTLNRLTITGTTFGLNQNFTDANQSLAVEARNSGTVANTTVSGSTFTGAPGDLANFTGQSGTTMDVIFQNNTCSDNHAQNVIGGGGITLATDGAMTFNASNNSLRDANGSAITLQKGSAGTSLNGTLDSNTIGVTGVANSGSASGNGIFLSFGGGGSITLAITNNDIRQYAGTAGILADNSGGSYSVDLTITGNTTAEPGASAFAGLALTAGNGSPTDTITVCASVTGNDFSAGDPNDTFDVYTAVGSGGSFLRLPGLVTSGSEATRQTQIQNFILSNNNVAGTNVFADVTAPATYAANYLGGAACMMAMMAAPPSASVAKEAAGAPQSDGVTANSTGKDELRAARGQAPPSDSVQKLRPEELNWIVQAALERWRQAKVADEDLARLRQATFTLAHLPGGQLASSTANQILIDETAAGYGWYFDQTPNDDSEFDVPVLNRERQTTDLSLAHGKMDLLTVVMRELGTVYLQGRNRVPKQLRPLMQPTLSPAVRRMPEFNVPDRSTSRLSPATGQTLNDAALANAPSPPKTDASAATLQVIPAVFTPTADLMPGSYGGSTKRMSYTTSARRVAYSPAPSGETVNLNIGTIPAGESVTIMFQVTINNPLPSGVCSVTNVGHVTGSNFSPVDTNSDVTNIVKPLTISACPANIVQNTDAGVCTAVVTYTTPTADGCPVPTVTCSPASGSAFAKGVTTVTCTASNGVSPDATCSFTVTVKDSEAPVCHLPADITQNNDAGLCTAVVTYTATATDNCGSATITCNPASGFAFPKGTTTVNCTASDDSPDSPDTNCSFTVTVKDTEAPVCHLPANITTNNTPNQCKAVVTYTATATDNCGGATISCSPSSGFAFPVGTTTVNCTASDTSPDSPDTNCSFTVTVKDTQAPTLSPCPANISVSSSGGCQVVTYPTPTATDNCGSATVGCSPPSGTCFLPGTTTVTCTASDTSPDSPDTSCSFTVTVVPCAITCPSNITVGNDPNQCGAVVTFAPSFGSGCGTVACTPASGSFFPVGTTTVTCITQAGPACSFTVKVNDTQGPTITVTTQPIEMWPPNHSYHTFNISDLVASATDNCSGNLINSVVIASVSSDEPENGSGDGNTVNDIVIAANCKSVQLRAERQGGGNGRVYTIVFKVTDTAGNVSTASRTVTVPANQGGGAAILGPGPGYTVTSSCP